MMVENATYREIEINQELQGNYDFATFIPSKCFIDKSPIINNRKKGFDKFFYLMPFYQERDLFEILHIKGISNLYKLDLMYKIIKAYQKLHSKGFLHLDTKPSNIFMMTKMTPVIADFGFVMKQTDKLNDFVGTPGYDAHEVRPNNYRPITPKYTIYADVFALGKSFYELIIGQSQTNRNKVSNLDQDPAYLLFEPLIKKMTRLYIPNSSNTNLSESRIDTFQAEKIILDLIVPIIDLEIPARVNPENKGLIGNIISSTYNYFNANPEEEKAADDLYMKESRRKILDNYFAEEEKIYKDNRYINKIFEKYYDAIYLDYTQRKSTYYSRLEEVSTNSSSERMLI
jgi:serine/threonine protein kinase